MKHLISLRKAAVLVVVLPIFLMGCQTLDYRSIQSEFEIAAQADNGSYTATITEQSPLTVATYDTVAAKLTDVYIAQLDPKLHPNAYLIRAFCEWRLGKTIDSRMSANKGIQARPERGSRDHVLLVMMKALNNEAEIQKDWFARGKRFDRRDYIGIPNSIENRYGEVMDGFEDASAQYSFATPESTKYYLSFQKYRVLQNWATIIQSLNKGSQASPDGRLLQSTALSGAKQKLKQSLGEAIKEARNAVPETHWLRQLM